LSENPSKHKKKHLGFTREKVAALNREAIVEDRRNQKQEEKGGGIRVERPLSWEQQLLPLGAYSSFGEAKKKKKGVVPHPFQYTFCLSVKDLSIVFE
jgi:hypothetical protein